MLAGAGATVVCVDIDAAAGAETAGAVLGQGGRAESVEVDGPQHGAAANLVDQVAARDGGLHVMCTSPAS